MNVKKNKKNAKNLLFWCPHIGNVGTTKAVLESAKSLSQSKNYKCKKIF